MKFQKRHNLPTLFQYTTMVKVTLTKTKQKQCLSKKKKLVKIKSTQIQQKSISSINQASPTFTRIISTFLSANSTRTLLLSNPFTHVNSEKNNSAESSSIHTRVHAKALIPCTFNSSLYVSSATSYGSVKGQQQQN